MSFDPPTPPNTYPHTYTKQNIPKRRQGPEELDIAVLEYLDETVRREARIALAVEGGWVGGWCVCPCPWVWV